MLLDINDFLELIWWYDFGAGGGGGGSGYYAAAVKDEITGYLRVKNGGGSIIF